MNRSIDRVRVIDFNDFDPLIGTESTINDSDSYDLSELGNILAGGTYQFGLGGNGSLLVGADGSGGLLINSGLGEQEFDLGVYLSGGIQYGGDASLYLEGGVCKTCDAFSMRGNANYLGFSGGPLGVDLSLSQGAPTMFKYLRVSPLPFGATYTKSNTYTFSIRTARRALTDKFCRWSDKC